MTALIFLYLTLIAYGSYVDIQLLFVDSLITPSANLSILLYKPTFLSISLMVFTI